MAEDAWFENWFNSPYYYQLYRNRDENEASAFVKDLINELHPEPGSLMLDVACGKGRHSLALSAMGYHVTGIDIAQDAIIEAKKKETKTLHFFQHDMRLPYCVNCFDYVFNFFTSFGYFKTSREHDNALACMAEALKPSGTLVIDYLNVKLAEKEPPADFIKDVDNSRFHIKKWQTDTHFYKQIGLVNTVGEEQILSTERVAKFGLEDFQKLFYNHKLVIKKLFGSYHLEAFDPATSSRLILLAEKQKS